MNYADFLFETYGKVKLDKVKLDFIDAVAEKTLTVDEHAYYQVLVESGHQNIFLEALNGGDYESLYEGINHDLILENLLKKAQERFKALKDKVADKGKEALDKMSDASKNLIKVGGNILKPLQAIVEKMGAAIAKAWEKVKSITAAAVEKAVEPITKRVKGLIEDGDKRKSLISEMGNVKATMAAGLKIATGGFADSIKKAGAKAATSSGDSNENVNIQEILDEVYEASVNSWQTSVYSAMITATKDIILEGYSIEDINEELSQIDFILEGGHEEKGGLKIPYISAIMDRIGHTFPFSVFHDLEKKAAKRVNNGLESASFWISKMGGPGPFTFPVVAGIIGIAIGFIGEQLAKAAVFGNHGATILGFAIPGSTQLYTIIKYTGYALAVYGVIKQAIGQGEKEGGADDHGDEKHSEEKKPEEKKEDGGEKKSEEKDKEKESK